MKFILRIAFYDWWTNDKKSVIFMKFYHLIFNSLLPGVHATFKGDCIR